MERTTRTAIALIAVGLLVALMSLFLQATLVKRLPPEKLKAAAQRKARPPQPPPSAERPPVREANGEAVAPSAAICRERLKDCFEGQDVDVRNLSLGDCYAHCVGVDRPDCSKKTCGDRCEAAAGLNPVCP